MTAPTEKLPIPPTLETARLILRPMRLEDAPSVQRRFPQWDVVRHLNDLVPWPYPDDGAETHIRQCLERRDRYYWSIFRKGGPDEAIGLISLRPDDGVSREQRGFWLDPQFHGAGLMTEAAERVTEYAFLELGWTELYLDNAEANPASHRIKEKQGARIIDRVPARFVSGEGVKVVWLLTREDWLKPRREASDGR
ncbi:MAG: GNAT family N-acetyltransferase [Caulobacterales bacterium]